MRSVPGEFTTTAGGGAEIVAAAMWNAVGVLVTATTEAPERSPGEGATAASGVTAASRIGATADGADAPTAPARTRGVMTATPKAGVRIDPRCSAPRCLEGGSSPYVHSTVLGLRWLVNQVTIPSSMTACYSNG